jgi:hypothetical protein
MNSPISLLLNHLAELHNSLTLSQEHMIEIKSLREEMENE